MQHLKGYIHTLTSKEGTDTGNREHVLHISKSIMSSYKVMKIEEVTKEENLLCHLSTLSTPIYLHETFNNFTINDGCE